MLDGLAGKFPIFSDLLQEKDSGFVFWLLAVFHKIVEHGLEGEDSFVESVYLMEELQKVWQELTGLPFIIFIGLGQ